MHHFNSVYAQNRVLKSYQPVFMWIRQTYRTWFTAADVVWHVCLQWLSSYVVLLSSRTLSTQESGRKCILSSHTHICSHNIYTNANCTNANSDAWGQWMSSFHCLSFCLLSFCPLSWRLQLHSSVNTSCCPHPTPHLHSYLLSHWVSTNLSELCHLSPHSLSIIPSSSSLLPAYQPGSLQESRKKVFQKQLDKFSCLTRVRPLFRSDWPTGEAGF